jgi:hypothetical protein
LTFNKTAIDEEVRLDHEYNPNGIYLGAFVDVGIGKGYTATVRSLTLDPKNKKIYAHLVNCEPNLPITVDVSDCRITMASTR